MSEHRPKMEDDNCTANVCEQLSTMHYLCTEQFVQFVHKLYDTCSLIQEYSWARVGIAAWPWRASCSQGNGDLKASTLMQINEWKQVAKFISSFLKLSTAASYLYCFGFETWQERFLPRNRISRETRDHAFCVKLVCAHAKLTNDWHQRKRT